MGRSQSSRSSSLEFAKLEPRIRHVSQATVKKRWKKLSTTSQENVRDVLTALQKQLVAGKHQAKSRDAAIKAVMDEVTNRLIQRLPRMPFPPTSHDENFDFEMTLHRIRNAEEQLTNNGHSMNLLRAQIKREEQLLEADKREVENLQEGLRSNDALRRRQNKNLHHVAKSCSMSANAARPGVSYINETPFSDFANDQALLPITRQLSSHLDSISNNTSSLQVVMDHIDQVSSSLAEMTDKTSWDQAGGSTSAAPT